MYSIAVPPGFSRRFCVVIANLTLETETVLCTNAKQRAAFSVLCFYACLQLIVSVKYVVQISHLRLQIRIFVSFFLNLNVVFNLDKQNNNCFYLLVLWTRLPLNANDDD